MDGIYDPFETELWQARGVRSWLQFWAFAVPHAQRGHGGTLRSGRQSYCDNIT